MSLHAALPAAAAIPEQGLGQMRPCMEIVLDNLDDNVQLALCPCSATAGDFRGGGG